MAEAGSELDTSAANSPQALQAVLRENLRELSQLLAGIDDNALDQRLEGEWSVREIVLHVVHAERWMHPQLHELRAAVAPETSAPALGGVTLPDPTTEPDLNELRWAINAVREDTERLLDGLTPAQLREPANIVVAEEVIDLSFRTMILTVADHQLFHVRQIARTLDR